jgi:hypothetical protein
MEGDKYICGTEVPAEPGSISDARGGLCDGGGLRGGGLRGGLCDGGVRSVTG